MNFFKKIKRKKVEDANDVKETETQKTSGEVSKANSTTINSEEQKLLFKAAYGGQCGVCTFAKLVSTSKNSHFIMCSHPQLPKYQGQPVLNCNFVEFRKNSKD